MQTPRVYDPNDQISLSLPARLVQTLFEVFHKNSGLGLSYDLVNELLVTMHTQLQAQEPPRPREEPIMEFRPELDGHDAAQAVQ